MNRSKCPRLGELRNGNYHHNPKRERGTVPRSRFGFSRSRAFLVPRLFSFPGSAWERTAPEALPRFAMQAKHLCLAIRQAEPASQWVPKQSPGPSRTQSVAISEKRRKNSIAAIKWPQKVAKNTKDKSFFPCILCIPWWRTAGSSFLLSYRIAIYARLRIRSWSLLAIDCIASRSNCSKSSNLLNGSPRIPSSV